MKQEIVNRHERRLRAEAERKTHYKMYKAGKRWTIAGMTVFTLGMITYLGNQQTVAAATDSATEQPASSTANDTSSKSATLDSANSQPAAADAAATTQGAAKSATGAVTSNTGAQTKVAVDAVSKTAEKTSDTDKQSSSADAGAATNGATDSTADAAKDDTQKQTAVQDNTKDLKDAASVSATATTTTVAAGDQAGFKVNLNTTGIKTTLHNAKLTLNLPNGNGVSLASDLSTLAINGTVPTLAADGKTLTYDFGDLVSGTSAAVSLGMKTSAASGAARSLTLSGELSSDESTIAIPDQTVTLSTEDRGGLTNQMSAIPDTKDTSTNHTNPIAGDTVNFDFGAWVPTSEPGTTLLQPGSTIQVKYALGPDLSYVGMVAGDGKVSDEPTVTVNSQGYTILTWNETAGTIEEQEAKSPTYNYTVQAKVADDVTDFTDSFTQAALSFTTDAGNSRSVTPVQASFTISPYNPRGRSDVDAMAFLPNYTYNTADGSGNAAGESGTNPDPTVQLENDPILFAHTVVTSGGPGAISTDDNLRYLALHVLLDPNAVLQGIQLGKGYYYPYSDYGQHTLADEPYATLAVKYAGEGDDVYHVLKGDINLAVSHKFSRADLIAMGLDPKQAVVNMYIYYHNTANPDQDIPANVDTFFTPNTDPNSLDLSIPDYTGFPDDAGVVNGFFENVGYWTSVADGYTGTITTEAYSQNDDGDTTDEASQTTTGYIPWWQHYLTPLDNKKLKVDGKVVGEQSTTDNQLPATVEVVHAPHGVQRNITANVDLSSATSTGGVLPGANNLKVSFTLGDNALVNLTTATDPFAAYILLPAGVTLSADDQSGATAVDDDYQGTGQQLVKATWSSYMVSPGQTMSLDVGVDIANDAPASLPIKTYIDLGKAEYNLTTVADDKNETVTKEADTQDVNGNGATDDSLIVINSLYDLAKTSQVNTQQNIAGTGTLTDGTASTQVGGQATVTLSTNADTDAKISALDLIDVLPSTGATGLTTTDERTADYQFTLNGPITLPAAWNGKTTVTYSTAATPDATDASQWQTAAAISDWTKVTAFRVTVAADSGIVIDGGSQTLSFVVNAPTNAKDFVDDAVKLADNTYSLSVNGLQKTEPHAVDLAIAPVTIDHGEYGTKRTIHYQDEAGNTLHPDTVQTVTYKTAKSSLDDRTTYTPKGIYAAQDTPTIAGYTTATKTVEQVTLPVTQVTPGDTEVTVIYTRNEADHGVYATTRTIHYRYADGTTAAPDVVQTLNYKTTTDEQTGETVYTPNGIYAAQKSPVIAGYEADTAEVALQTVGVSTTKPKNTEVTVIYTGDAVRHGIYKTTRTIHYRYADGTTAVPDVVQTLTYKTSTDLKTGKTVYTPQGFYLEQSTPLLTGYAADITQVDKEVKGATSTTPQNEAVIVTFSKLSNTTPGNPGGGTPTTTPGGNTPTVTPGNPGGNTPTTTTTTPGNPGGDTPTTTTTTPENPDGKTTTTTTTTTPGGDLPDTNGDDTPSTTTDTGTGTAVTPTPTAKVTTGKKTPVQQLAKTQGKRAAALPQTGDDDGNKMSILGLALASFLGMLGLGVKKRREE